MHSIKSFNNSSVFSVFALIVSIVATVLSLRLSLVLGLEPCKLCWYQRIFIYPIPVVLSVLILSNIQKQARFILPLAIPGFGIALYHSYIQMVNDPLCGSESCSVVLYRMFGFSIPNLAAISFALIIMSMTAHVLLVKYSEYNSVLAVLKS